MVDKTVPVQSTRPQEFRSNPSGSELAAPRASNWQALIVMLAIILRFADVSVMAHRIIGWKFAGQPTTLPAIS